MKHFTVIWILGFALSGPPSAFTELSNPGFELVPQQDWIGPWGGGTGTGTGDGKVVRSGPGIHVRSGAASFQLKVWNEGEAESFAWASLAQLQPCVPDSRVRAGVWIYASDTEHPLANTGTVAQLCIEYYFDERAENIVPTHVVMSSPFSRASMLETNGWFGMHVSDRVPPDARTMKISIMLMSENPGREPQAVWIDDVYVNVREPGGRARSVQPVVAPPDPPPAAPEPRKPWWRLFF